MADLHEFPSLSQAQREASEWIARLDAEDVSADERDRFEQWRSAHSANARAFSELSATYREFVATGPFVRAVSFAQSMSTTSIPRKRGRWLSAAAAVLVLALVMGAIAYWPRSTTLLTYRTALGEHATIALPDGSTLELNSDSSARVEYRPAQRVVRLEHGEGYFKVAHDPMRPFWVVAGHSWIRAVGTAFDVYLRTSTVEVTVSEGAVKVGSAAHNVSASVPNEATRDDPAVVVKAGEQAKVQGASTATRPLSSLELARAVSWREGTLYFENQPLSEVSAELERYGTVRYVLEDDAVRHLRVGGTFQASPQGAETLITMLERGFDLRVRREGDRVYVASQSEPSHL